MHHLILFHGDCPLAMRRHFSFPRRLFFDNASSSQFPMTVVFHSNASSSQFPRRLRFSNASSSQFPTAVDFFTNAPFYPVPWWLLHRLILPKCLRSCNAPLVLDPSFTHDLLFPFSHLRILLVESLHFIQIPLSIDLLTSILYPRYVILRHSSPHLPSRFYFEKANGSTGPAKPNPHLMN